MLSPETRIAVIGLGYVGLPVALAFAKHFPNTFGFDVNKTKVQELKSGLDRSREVERSELESSRLQFTTDPKEITGIDYFLICVPTPIDENRRPDLSPLVSACETISAVMKPGATIIFESTVYPGVTEEVCGPVIARATGLKQGVDFKLAYSPERINPGDREHTLERVTKVVSGEDAETLDRVAKLYETIVRAGVFRAASIKAAEAAKVIENTQRDLNIALMNELSLIFDRIGVSSRDVLDAADTKWNFLRFRPGLVGGHCIGVDPYYLTEKAQRVGYHPEVILAGRRINDGMGIHIAQKLIKLLTQAGCALQGARVGIFGITFKENVSDIRNSRVPDIIKELRDFGIEVLIHDPFAFREETIEEYGIELDDISRFENLDAMVLAVSHRPYLEDGGDKLFSTLKKNSVVIDVKSALNRSHVPPTSTYWSL